MKPIPIYHPARMKHRGFTLIELMIVLGIMGILAAMGLASGGGSRAKAMQREVVRNVMYALMQGRAEAIRQGRSVSVHLSNTSFVAFYDDNNDELPSAGEKVVFRFTPDSQTRYLVDSVKLVSGNPAGKITALFTYQGLSENRNGQPLSAIVCIYDTQLLERQAVALTVAGAVRILPMGKAMGLCT